MFVAGHDLAIRHDTDFADVESVVSTGELETHAAEFFQPRGAKRPFDHAPVGLDFSRLPGADDLAHLAADFWDRGLIGGIHPFRGLSGGIIERLDRADAGGFQPSGFPCSSIKRLAGGHRLGHRFHSRNVKVADQAGPDAARIVVHWRAPGGDDLFGVGLPGQFVRVAAAVATGEVQPVGEAQIAVGFQQRVGLCQQGARGIHRFLEQRGFAGGVRAAGEREPILGTQAECQRGHFHGIVAVVRLVAEFSSHGEKPLDGFRKFRVPIDRAVAELHDLPAEHGMRGEAAVNAGAQVVPRTGEFGVVAAVAVGGVGGEPGSRVDGIARPRGVAHQLIEHFVVIESLAADGETGQVAFGRAGEGFRHLAGVEVHFSGVGGLSTHVGHIAHDPGVAMVAIEIQPILIPLFKVAVFVGVVQDQQLVVRDGVEQGFDRFLVPDVALVVKHPSLQDPDRVGIGGADGVVGGASVVGEHHGGRLVGLGKLEFVETIHQPVAGIAELLFPLGDERLADLRPQRRVRQHHHGSLGDGKTVVPVRGVELYFRVDSLDAGWHEAGEALDHRLDAEFLHAGEKLLLKCDLVAVP